MGRVFLSYSRRDRAVAEAIAKALRNAGIELFDDAEDSLIAPGESWRDTLEEALHRADLVIVLWSKTSSESLSVTSEADFAFQLDKLFPVAVEGLHPNQIPLPFRVLNSLALPRDPFHAPDPFAADPGAFEPLVEAVKARLAREQVRPTARAEPGRATVRPERKRPRDSAAERPQPAEPSREATAAPTAAERPQTAARAEASAAEDEGAATAEAAGPPPIDVFISYSRKDRHTLRLFFEAIARGGPVVWYDEEVGVGAFREAIEGRISEARVFVLLLSKNALASPNVEKELIMADRSGTAIVPLSIDGVTDGDLTGTFRYELLKYNIFQAPPEDDDKVSEAVDLVLASVKTLAEADPRPERAPLALAPPPATQPAAADLPADPGAAPRRGGGARAALRLALLLLVGAQCASAGAIAYFAVGLDALLSAAAAAAATVVAVPLAALSWRLAVGAR